MPYYANGTWYNWSTYTTNFTQTVNSGSQDPISGMVSMAIKAVPVLMPLFLGALYVFLWVRFANAPSRFKFVGMGALVLSISVVSVFAGFTADAVLNFIVFVAAYFLSLLFKA